jgi:hypothetical protein
MAQITIYLDSKTEQKMKKITSSKKISQSKWIANLIKEKLRDDWPDSILELSGSWKGFPIAEELRKTIGKDIKREEL